MEERCKENLSLPTKQIQVCRDTRVLEKCASTLGGDGKGKLDDIPSNTNMDGLFP